MIALTLLVSVRVDILRAWFFVFSRAPPQGYQIWTQIESDWSFERFSDQIQYILAQ